MADINEEKVVMTPKCKTATSTTLVIERRLAVAEPTDKIHVAGGDHTGIIINKEQVYENGVSEPCHTQLEFRVYLVNAATGTHTKEARALRFWFKPQMLVSDRPQEAQKFFRELVSPLDFPKDYVGFIKKIMKLMQHKFHELRILEVELRQEGTGPPPKAFIQEMTMPVITEDIILELIENAYPNAVTLDDFVRAGKWSPEEVKSCLNALEVRGLARAMPEGCFIRQHSIDTQVVGQMPALSSSRQPTIAVITALYCEKMAVDAMMDNQETFVRYTTVGESNVYTLGTIGSHRVVTTKLPKVGHTREAVIAAGNTTTRLLGTFQKVEYVFLVGVGGGVPHYTDYSRHVRLGDVVLSTPATDLENKYVYMYCESALPNKTGGWDYEVRPYRPASFYLQELAYKLQHMSAVHDAEAPWIQYHKDGMKRLESQLQQWTAPKHDTDTVCVDLGQGAFIEVSAPAPVDEVDRSRGTVARLHCAPVAAGRVVSGSDASRVAFASHARALAYDCELDTVLESVIGNRKDCFISIRGISDYRDGTRGKDWQPHAALTAASVMKAIICFMPPPTD